MEVFFENRRECYPGRKPKGWKKALRYAEWLCVDEMRCLLELHYDDVHFETFAQNTAGNNSKKYSRGKGDFKVKVNAAARQKRFETLELPTEVRAQADFARVFAWGVFADRVARNCSVSAQVKKILHFLTGGRRIEGSRRDAR